MKTRNIVAVGVIAILFAPGIALAQSLDPTRYCPDTTTDPDGDGWGWENGRSCVVITSPRSTIVCPVIYAETDPDDDGWGWTGNNGQSCLVDNTSVDYEFTVTDVSDRDITASGYPIISSHVKSFGTFAFDFLVAADGTIYQFRVPDETLAATDTNGETLWLQTNGNYMELLELSEDDSVIYAIVYDTDTTIAAIDSGTGEILQKIVDANGIKEVLFGSTALIAVLEQDEAGSINRLISLNYDGSLRWKLANPLPLNAVTLGKDGKIYVKEQSDPYGNEITLVLEQ